MQDTYDSEGASSGVDRRSVSDAKLSDTEEEESAVNRGRMSVAMKMRTSQARSTYIVRKKKTPVKAIEERSEAKSMMKVKMN